MEVAATSESRWTLNPIAYCRSRSTGRRSIRFPGQYYDDETGLHYNRFRYYDPGVGRYISADAIGQLGIVGTNGRSDLAFLPSGILSAQRVQGQVNVYQYAHGNPLLFVDPFGLDDDAADAFWSSSKKQLAAQAICGLAAAAVCGASPGLYCAAAGVAAGGAILAIQILGTPDTAEEVGGELGDAIDRRLDRLGDIDENTSEPQSF